MNSRWIIGAGFLLLLLAMPQRAPAPIQEVPESPTPAPKVKKQTTPRPKPKPSPTEAAGNGSSKQSPAKTGRFAGKWKGVMPEVPWGNVPTELTIDESESTMHWTESGKEKATAKATIVNGTIQANFMVGVAETWSLTPLADGNSALVRLRAMMNNQTATFHRVAK
jgi:hypothetical protein